MMPKQIIVIVGFMMAGKTTVGKAVAEKHHLPFCDLDGRIENSAGKSISEIFAQNGELEFRRLESLLFSKLMDSLSPLTLVAAGGGLPLAAENQEKLKNCAVIFLDTDFAVIEARLDKAGDSRPLLRNLNSNQLAQLWKKRCEIYNQVSDFVVKNESQLSELVIELKSSIESTKGSR